jgi:hypothetical protein
MRMTSAVRWTAFMATLWVYTTCWVHEASAQPVCNVAGGFVEVDQLYNAGPPALNDEGLLAYGWLNDLSHPPTKWIRIGSGDDVVTSGPYEWGGGIEAYDINNDDAVILGYPGQNISALSGQVVASIGARFTRVGRARMNDHEQIVFLAEERLPDDSLIQGLYLAEPDVAPVRVPIPPGYH